MKLLLEVKENQRGEINETKWEIDKHRK
jgi:hypothetical protein